MCGPGLRGEGKCAELCSRLAAAAVGEKLLQQLPIESTTTREREALLV